MSETEQETPQEIVPVETEEKAQVVKEIPMSAPPPTEKPPSASTPGSSLGRFLKGVFFFLLRLMVILVLLSILAISIAYLGPLVYDRYVRPVEMNAAQVADLQNQQTQSAEQIASLQTRLATAEVEQAKQVQTVTELSSRLQNVENSIAEHTQKLATLDEMQSELMQANEASLTAMSNQLDLLKALETLSRARLFLYQSNFGLARDDVQSARDILAGLQDKTSTPELKEAVFRLDLVLKNLPEFPVAANDDLNLAWVVLVQGLPSQTPSPSESATPTPASTESVMPMPVTDFTPTPVKPIETPTTKP